MRQGRPVAVIAELEGLEPDYCRKATRRLAAAHDIDYKPGEAQPILTDATYRFRSNMANVMYTFRNQPGQHPLAVARDTGLTQAQQVQASQRPYGHNFTIGQLERIASATGQDFTRMMIVNLLKGSDPGRLQKILALL